MNKFALSISAAVFVLSTPGAVLAEHHQGGHDGHKMEKMEDGTMQCCMTDNDGKKVCHVMDHDKMDHSKMDHSKMDHGKMDHSKMGHGNMEQADADTAAEEPN